MNNEAFLLRGPYLPRHNEPHNNQVQLRSELLLQPDQQHPHQLHIHQFE